MSWDERASDVFNNLKGKKVILSNKLRGLPLKTVPGFARGRRSWCCALINFTAKPGNQCWGSGWPSQAMTPSRAQKTPLVSSQWSVDVWKCGCELCVQVPSWPCSQEGTWCFLPVQVLWESSNAPKNVWLIPLSPEQDGAAVRHQRHTGVTAGASAPCLHRFCWC